MLLRSQRICLTALLATSFLHAPAQTLAEHWVGTWAASPYAQKNDGGPAIILGEAGVTLRQIAHVSIGGRSVRIVLSNEFGIEPLAIAAAGIAVRSKDSAIVSLSATPLTFGGRTSVVIPPGAMVVTDAATLSVKPLSDIAVSLFVPAQAVSVLSRHGSANQTNYMLAGNAVTSPALDGAKTFTSWSFLKGIDVKTDGASLVAFGDSITDGAHSTRDRNARWPDILSARLAANQATAKIGVLNEGIGGNRVLHDTTGPSALARFDRDVIAQAGVKYVVLMESINDIGHATDPDSGRRHDIVSADDLIAGLAQLARRAHTHGIQVFGATLTPFAGADYQSPAGETVRQTLNAWIRSTPEFDGVIDFDKATADPVHPEALLPAYDSGDHLHPKDAGYRAMGESIDLKLITR